MILEKTSFASEFAYKANISWRKKAHISKLFNRLVAVVAFLTVTFLFRLLN